MSGKPAAARWTHKKSLLMCMCMLLAAALALAAVVTLTTLEKGKHATTKRNDETRQLLRRDFVTLKDIEPVGTAAAAGRVSPRDGRSGAFSVKLTWPPWPPHPASVPSPPSMSLEDTIPKIAAETARLVNVKVQRLSQTIKVGERMQGSIEQSSCRKI